MRILLSFISVFIISASAMVAAQEQEPIVSESEGDQAVTESDTTEPELVFDEVLDSSEDEASDSEDTGSDRFIPTEQISQDLGVSFPADI